ncbi:hypothetical protein [Kitasatospora sp. NPDC018619]|uniref:hypothetical protein n=1 Tax=unclassified Kitasatospora TaxID=2633591 RepID=UPI0037BD603A
MATDRTTRTVGAGVGLVHLQTGAGALPTAFEVPVRVLSVAAFLGIVGVGQWWGGREEPPDRPAGPAGLLRRPAVRVLGGAVALCWAAGLALALGGAPAAAAGTAAGIVPGALLLGSVWWWAARPRRSVPGRPTR